MADGRKHMAEDEKVGRLRTEVGSGKSECGSGKAERKVHGA
jgi:hypothetical protein